ncbi:hypothetical protein ACHAWF_014793 [Thalassiosira exigua]
MKRHAHFKDRQNHGGRQLSAAARAALARASGRPNPEPTPRSSAANFRRNVTLEFRSVFYRIVSGTVIAGNPEHHSEQANSLFRRSLLGCALCVYIPFMGIGYVLVKHASRTQEVEAAGGMDQLQRLKHQSFPHGSYYFGHTSHDAAIPEKSMLRQHRNQVGEIGAGVKADTTTCARYGLGFTNKTLARKRRIFLGVMIGDDSMQAMRSIGAETYNIFHTVSFIETHLTHNWIYSLKSDNLQRLHEWFGPKTKVSVDYYVSALNLGDYFMLTDTLRREGSNLRWELNGMSKEDVGIIADTGETFSKDILWALSACDFPELLPDQTCYGNNAFPSTVIHDGHTIVRCRGS